MMKKYFPFFFALLMVLSCTRQQDQKSTVFFAPTVVEAKGYVVPKDSMTEPKVISVDESKLKKIPVGKPTVVAANTNIHPAGIPKIVLAGVPGVTMPGQDSFSLPKTVIAIDSPFMAAMPELVTAKDAHIKDQNPQNFSILSNLKGLINNYITCLIEDHNGNLWIGTNGGVSKYDGKSFTQFTVKNGLSSNSIVEMMQDKAGNMWFGTFSNGVTKYDGKSFTHFKVKDGLGHNHIGSMMQDKAGNIWIGTVGGGVSKYNGETITAGQATFTHFTKKQGLPDNDVYTLLQDKSGAIWFGTSKGISKYDGKSFTTFSEKEGLSGNLIYGMLQEKNGDMWFSTYGRGVSKYDGRSFTHFTEKEGLSNNNTNALLQDNNGNLYIGTSGGGVSKYDGKSFTHLTETEGLSNNYLSNNCLLQDRRGNIWMGTNGAGLSKYDGKSLSHITQKEGIFNFTEIKSRANDFVFSTLQDNNGNLWFGANDGGLSKYDGKSFMHFTKKEGLSNNSVMSIVQDKSGNFWFATFGGGVSKYDGRYFTNFTVKEGLPVDYVESSLLDNNGDLWFGTRRGASKYDGKKFTSFTVKEGLSSNRVTCMMQDHSGNMWFGTADGGASKYDGKSFTHFTKKEGLSNNFVFCMLEDNSGNIWLGTNGGGIIRYDGKTFTNFTEKEGLISNSVWSMLQDRKGNLWVGSPVGLSKLSKEKLAEITAPGSTGSKSNTLNEGQVLFKNFTYEDGFLGIGCTHNSIYEDNDVTIWIGASDRLTAYHPEGEVPDTIAPNIQLTGLSLFNENIGWANLQKKKDSTLTLGNGVKVSNVKFDGLTKWYGLPEHLSLAYNNNYLTFNFIGITLKSPKKVKYQFKLDGIDKNWSAITSSNEAPYGNMPHGTFIFRVKAMNSEGYWSDELSYTFTIRPPLWRTWLAYAIYVLLAGLFIYYLNRRERKRLAKKNERILQQKEAEQNVAMDAVKTRFFSNITHEFRTPLTLIISPVDELMKEEDMPIPYKKTLSTVQRNANQLLELINQLLDLSKVEAGKMKVDIKRGDVGLYLAELTENFLPYALQKNIQLKINNEVTPTEYLFDAGKWERISSNLLSNAIKFTAEGGRIDVGIFENNKDEKHFITLTVKDTGTGIAPEKLPHIFDRFYQADTSSTRLYEGTGIGLALVKEFVDLMNGRIDVQSKPGEGTTFTLNIPVDVATDIAVEALIIPQKANQQPLDAIDTSTDENIVSPAEAPLILVAEDNPDLNTFIAGSLQKNYRVITALNGTDAWALCKTEIPDIVLSDVMMPGMDGNELCAAIKSDPLTAHIAVVMLTVKTAPTSVIEGLSKGADDYISKPFKVDELLLRIHNLLERQKKLQQYFRSHLVLTDDKAGEPLVQDEFVQSVYIIIDEFIDDSQLGVEFLATKLALSRRTLNRKLSAVLGLPPSEIIKQYRLKKGAEMLRSGNHIADTAYSTGFESPSYFGQCFKEVYGLTPSDYIDKNRLA